jgi:hypothetical protein
MVVTVFNQVFQVHRHITQVVAVVVARDQRHKVWVVWVGVA